MNEIAAVLLYVMSVDPERAETDAFWCFSEMMVVPWPSHISGADAMHVLIQANLSEFELTSCF